MIDEEKKTAQENQQLILNKIFTLAMDGVRFVRLKVPVRTSDSSGFDSTVEVVLADTEMEEVFKVLKRGCNRVCRVKGTTPFFPDISDQPDPEKEFDKQLFEMQADLLDRMGKAESNKEKVDLARALRDLMNTQKRQSIRKLDLKLAVALAKKLDPTITEQGVIDILKFESERL